MNNYFDDVAAFHEKMGLPVSAESLPLAGFPQVPRILSESDFRFRFSFLQEEIRELVEGQSTGDLAQLADALVDIVYVALGTAHYAGIPFDAIWNEVQRSNMEKRPWREGDPVKPRNVSGLEVVKPEGWKPPQINSILVDFAQFHGFPLELRLPMATDFQAHYGDSNPNKPFVLEEGAFGGELDPYSPGAQK